MSFVVTNFVGWETALVFSAVERFHPTERERNALAPSDGTAPPRRRRLLLGGGGGVLVGHGTRPPKVEAVAPEAPVAVPVAPPGTVVTTTLPGAGGTVPTLPGPVELGVRWLGTRRTALIRRGGGENRRAAPDVGIGFTSVLSSKKTLF